MQRIESIYRNVRGEGIMTNLDWCGTNRCSPFRCTTRLVHQRRRFQSGDLGRSVREIGKLESMKSTHLQNVVDGERVLTSKESVATSEGRSGFEEQKIVSIHQVASGMK